MQGKRSKGEENVNWMAHSCSSCVSCGSVEVSVEVRDAEGHESNTPMDFHHSEWGERIRVTVSGKEGKGAWSSFCLFCLILSASSLPRTLTIEG